MRIINGREMESSLSRYVVHKILKFLSRSNPRWIALQWPDAQRYAMLWTAPLSDLVRRLRRSLLECCRNPRDIVAIYNTGLFTHRLLVNSLVGVILRRGWRDLADIEPILRAHSKYNTAFQ